MEHGDRIDIYADFDLGHMERSRCLHTDNVIDPAIKIFEDMLKDLGRAKTIKIISLNQYIWGKNETHERPNNGDIDFTQAAKLIGQSMHAGNLKNPVTIFETHPIYYKWFFSREGIVYCEGLEYSFNQGANK
ncbi:MAG TPA: hypothetical protein VLF89_04445 [Candidatus Saccharimonadales bacterium]|nr:hypothetical protein [Candidatus Saccharimonadales bacterium]